MHPFLIILIFQSLCFLYVSAVLAMMSAWAMFALFIVLALAICFMGILVYFKRLTKWMYTYLGLALLMVGFCVFHLLLLLRIPSNGLFGFSSLVYGSEISKVYKGNGRGETNTNTTGVQVKTSLSGNSMTMLILAIIGYSSCLLFLTLAFVSTCFLPSLTKSSKYNDDYQCPQEFQDPLYKRFTQSFMPPPQNHERKINFVASPYKKPASPPYPTGQQQNLQISTDGALLPDAPQDNAGDGNGGYSAWAADILHKTKGWFAGTPENEEHRPNSHLLQQRPMENAAPQPKPAPPQLDINPASILKHENESDAYSRNRNYYEPQPAALFQSPPQAPQYNASSSITPINRMSTSNTSSYGRGTLFKDMSIFTPIITEPISKPRAQADLEEQYHALMKQNASTVNQTSHNAMNSLIASYDKQSSVGGSNPLVAPSSIPNSGSSGSYTRTVIEEPLNAGSKPEAANQGIYNWWFGNNPSPSEQGSVFPRKASKAYTRSTIKRAPSKLVTCSSGVMLKCSDCLQLIPLNEAANHHCTKFSAEGETIGLRDTLIDAAMINKRPKDPIPAVPKIPEYYFDSTDYC